MRWATGLLLAVAWAGAAAAESARHVGAAVCASCHASQAKAWQGSHHQLAMQPVSRPAVLAPFEGEQLKVGEVTSTFSQRHGRFLVRTEGADGRLRDYEIVYVLGVTPLQQYLVAMPNGALQALALAWDTRPAAQGGQRWLHLQAGKPPKPGDELHWTGRQMNANFMCVDCHVTGFQKNYNPPARRYASKWAEGNVSCEACHGPGSAHAAWARQPGNDPAKGLTVRFEPRASWQIDSATGNARGQPAARTTETNVCARCHAHRSRIAEDAGPGTPLMDAYRPSLVEPGLFWNDGQMRAEVYNHISFAQSRMHAKGVRCSDCHDPHSQKLRAPGNAVCLQCHAAPKYEAKTHHFHSLGSQGAQCVGCHMPPSNYMRIDKRHDHFIRVPHPAQSQQHGSPDACTQCHADKPRAWAIQWTQRWYPHLAQRASKMAAALLALDREDWEMIGRLSTLLGDAAEPAVARASVLARLPPQSRQAWAQAARALADAEPLVRLAAVQALRGADAPTRAALLQPMLRDPVRSVRIEAARWLAGVPLPHDRPAFDRALNEYLAAQRLHADRPEAWDNIGTLRADMGEHLGAQAAFRQAMALAPDFAASPLNLADLLREQGREAQAQALIESVVRRDPGLAPAQHALGLSLLRQGKMPQALAVLKTAQELDAADARIARTYALALQKQGRLADAMAVLRRALVQRPHQPELLRAASAIARAQGDAGAAERYRADWRRVVELEQRAW